MKNHYLITFKRVLQKLRKIIPFLNGRNNNKVIQVYINKDFLNEMRVILQYHQKRDKERI